jgi:putative two-component system response regulator
MPQTILIVDDDAANRELLEHILETAGFSVACAGDGQQALIEFERTSPDLVLLDVQMPNLNGFEVCRRFKSNPGARLIPVVLVTALSAVQDRVRGLEAGADDFLIKPVDRSELIARVRSLLSLKAFTDELEQAETVLFSLAQSIEGKDPYTEGHCQRLSDYSAYLGERMGLPLEQITALRRAGVVHDIGKIAVPDAILLKPAKLTTEEFKVMQQHPLLGERICGPLKSFRLVLPIIRHHHEKRDGTGYPDGLKGDQIPLTARILQVVDVFDALTTLRPYKRALSVSEALEVMDEEVKKGWWDPEIFSQFKQFVAEFEDLNSMMGIEGYAKAASVKRVGER